jgi:hypothetical protein
MNINGQHRFTFGETALNTQSVVPKAWLDNTKNKRISWPLKEGGGVEVKLSLYLSKHYTMREPRYSSTILDLGTRWR